MGTASEQLSAFAEQLQFKDIPSKVIERVKLHILDILGIGLAASDMDFARIVVETARAWGGVPQSTVLRYGDRLPAPSAVLINGSFTHGLDFDDTHTESITHVSTCIVPPALAVAESLQVDGKALLTATVIGYEVITRLGAAAPGAFHHHGYHATPICGTFAAGMVAGKLMGLSPDELANTLGICGSQAAGLQAFLDDGSWTKRLHPGWAAHGGVVSAQLAMGGFQAPKTVLEGRFGLYASHVGQDHFNPARLTKGLGEDWESTNIAFKPYPVCHFSHAGMDAALALQRQHHFKPDDIVSGEVLVPEQIVPIVCEPLADKQKPVATYGALFSLPFCAATNLVHGHARLDNFTEEALQNREVLATAAKIGYCVEPWPEFPNTFPGGIRLTLRDGRKLEWREPINRGHPDNPMPADEVRDKFRDNAKRALPSGRIEAIINVVDQLEELSRVSELMTLCITPD
ncbi:MAG: MmgE/PrpD family protein [bacterium]|nr:MmgE/PrpD family protein [bacterium]